MKKIIVLLLFILTISSGCFVFIGRNSPPYSDLNVLRINQKSTGFFVGNYVVTCSSMVPDSIVIVTIPNYKMDTNKIGVVIARDEINDIALIKLTEPRNVEYELGGFDNSGRSQVTVLGFGTGKNKQTFDARIEGVSEIDSRNIFLEITPSCKPSYLGAPVVDDKDRLIGMIRGKVKNSNKSNRTHVVPIQHIVLFIEKQRS